MAVSGRMSRAEWELRDPNGWERAECAEAGVPVEYSDEDADGKPKRKPSRIERLMECLGGTAEVRRAQKRKEPPRNAAAPVSRILEMTPQQTPPPKPARHVRHVASCRNCAKAEHCRLAALGREMPCQEWWAAHGCNVKWSDYE